MATILVDEKVFEQLKQAYSKEYGCSPSTLVVELNKKYESRLEALRTRKGASSARDLISDKTIRNFFGAIPPVTAQERNLNYLCGLLLGYNSYREAVESLSKELSLPR
jgi:predicted CopG family antitoxin